MDRKSFETLFVSHIDCFFLCDMFFQIWHLTTNNTCNDVRHSVVIADFFVLIPRSSLTALCGPFSHFIRISFTISQKHTT